VNVAELIVQDLVDLGYTDCFAIAGGASAHILDALARQNTLRVHFMLHEQSCAMAADSYFRYYGRPAAVLVTNGPGVSNTITGVLGAFQDSIPMFCLSGQVPQKFITPATSNLRQLGVQESLTENLVGSIVTKFVRLESSSVGQLIPSMHAGMMSGRMGPVWLEVPLNIQVLNAEIGLDTQPNFGNQPSSSLENQIPEIKRVIIDGLSKSSRPLVVLGNGVRISGSQARALDLIKSLGIPVVATWSGADMIAHNNPLYIGNFGILGERAANHAIQKADYLLILGSRLSIPNIGYQTENFSPDSFKAMVDIDEAELGKDSITIDLKVLCDLRSFLKDDLGMLKASKERSDWLASLQALKEERSLNMEAMSDSEEGVDAYRVMLEVSGAIENFDAIVTDMGSSFTVTMQALRRDGRARVLTSSGTSSMGFGLPGALGIALADADRKILCIAGDGGLQMNLQELHTMATKTSNLKLIVLDSNGYLAISLMQDNIFQGRHFGSTPDSGVSSPDFPKVLRSFQIETLEASSTSHFLTVFADFVNNPDLRALVVKLPRNQVMRPRVQTQRLPDGTLASPSLDSMWPPIETWKI